MIYVLVWLILAKLKGLSNLFVFNFLFINNIQKSLKSLSFSNTLWSVFT